MSVVSQLFQLQEIDQALDAGDREIKRITAQLGESKEVMATRRKLASEQQQLAELKKRQNTLETEISDLSVKITATERGLYSGSISNPKELTSLQQEVDLLKKRRSQLEDEDLQIMGQLEQVTADADSTAKSLESLESAWQTDQQRLKGSLEKLRSNQLELKDKRQPLATMIASPVVAEYEQLRKHKGSAIAKVEQGICQGCRIALSVAQLREIRGDSLIHCGSCGRILFQT